jgi:hypothetical protein
MAEIMILLETADAILKKPFPSTAPKNDADVIKYVKEVLNTFQSIPTKEEQITHVIKLYEYFNQDVANAFVHKHAAFKHTIMMKLNELKTQCPDELQSISIRGC